MQLSREEQTHFLNLLFFVAFTYEVQLSSLLDLLNMENTKRISMEQVLRQSGPSWPKIKFVWWM